MLTVSLKHRFPGFTLDVDFEAPPGVTALFGKSGSGKTTIVNAIAGLLRPDSGRIAVNDRVLLDRAAGVNLPVPQRRVGYVFQDHRLFPHMTVRRNLNYGARLAPPSADSAADFDSVIAMLGIGALLDRRPATLSGGERSRVAIGRALLSRPWLLILDEPMAALDEGRRAEIMPYLEKLRDTAGVPILYISHSVAEVVRLATTLVAIDKGHVVGAGPLVDLLAKPASAALLDAGEVGAVLPASVAAIEADGLARLESAAGPLWVPEAEFATGDNIRLRVRAQDVILSCAPPQPSSALNVFKGRVAEIGEGMNGTVLVAVALQPDGRLLAQVTRRSVSTLGLQPGSEVHAIVKSAALG